MPSSASGARRPTNGRQPPGDDEELGHAAEASFARRNRQSKRPKTVDRHCRVKYPFSRRDRVADRLGRFSFTSQLTG
jgi:hypothetical protein